MTTHTPSQRATAWLQAFGAALASEQPAQANALFDADSYWRDLVAFTWNVRTQEGPAAIADMLAARAADTAASNFALEGEATEADGIVDAWFTFETRVARGRGHLRLKATPAGDRAWTLLTTMTELKGFEEKKGTRRIAGAEHGDPRLEPLGVGEIPVQPRKSTDVVEEDLALRRILESHHRPRRGDLVELSVDQTRKVLLQRHLGVRQTFSPSIEVPTAAMGRSGRAVRSGSVGVVRSHGRWSAAVTIGGIVSGSSFGRTA